MVKRFNIYDGGIDLIKCLHHLIKTKKALQLVESLTVAPIDCLHILLLLVYSDLSTKSVQA